MAKSFVLKDQAGKAAGYLIHGFGTLQCRFAGNREGAKAVVFYEDGSAEEHVLTADRSEQSWTSGGKAVSGAVIAFGDEIAALSDQDALRRFETLMRRKLKETEKKDAQVYRAQETHDDAQAANTTCRTVQERRDGVMPQRRWPPPPCMGCAVYKCGQWMENDE